MSSKSLSNISLDSSEFCFLVGDQKFTNESFKVRHAKLMPLIPADSTPKTVNVIFNSSIFANDSSCKPSVSKNLTTQNYITMNRDPGSILYHLQNGDGIIKSGTRLKCTSYNKNIKDITIIDS